MKANNGDGNIPSRDEWQTPIWLFDILNNQYNFQFDCCATNENKKTSDFSEFYFEDIDKVDKIAWMNPPFSKAKSMFLHFFKVVDKGVAIYRCDNMETETWQKYIFPHCSWIFIPNKRICYEGLNKKGMKSGSRFPSALIGKNIEFPKNISGILVKTI